MWKGLKRLTCYFWSVLIKDSIPVWLSLCLMVVGAFATYYIAPLINQQFQIQEARREFLVKNLGEFSSDTKSLIDVVYKAINETDQQKFDTQISGISPTVSKLQFSATQLLYVVPDDAQAITLFQKNLDEMQDSLISHKVGSDPSLVLAQAKILMRQSLNIYEILLAKAGLGKKISKQ